MITREQLRKPGARFVLNQDSMFKRGTIVTLRRDDYSGCPFFWNEDQSDYCPIYLKDLDMVEKDLNSLKVGDILYRGSYYRKVLGVINSNLYAISGYGSSIDSINESSIDGGVWSVKDIEDRRYNIYPQSEVEELTVEEVSKRLGKTIKIVE